MKKRNKLLLRSIRLALLLFILGLISGLRLLWYDYTLAFLTGGLFGLSGLIVLAFGGIRGRRATAVDDSDVEAHYLALVRDAREDPGKFQKELEQLLGLGLRYQLLLLSLLFMSLSATAGLAIVRSITGFGFFIIVLMGLIFRIVSTILPLSEDLPGDEVTDREMPEVFRLIDSARAPLDLPRPRRIFLYPGENCGVSRAVRKKGLVREDWMIIGTYLLELLTPEELTNVFIHEFAHIGHGDTALAARVTSRMQRWLVISAMSEHALVANVLLRSFAETYVVSLTLADRALSKLEERLADDAVLKHGDAMSFARATLKMELISNYLNEGLTFSHYPSDVRENAEPPSTYHSDLLRHFRSDFDKSGDEWIQLVLKRMSHDLDTHPSIRERLADLGVDASNWPLDFPRSSARQSEVSQYAARFDAQWQEDARANWNELQEDFLKASQVVRAFSLSDDEYTNMDYGMALEDLGKSEDAAAFYHEVLKRSPRHVPAMFRLGTICLAQNDDNGLPLLKEALELDPEFVPLGLEAIQDYLYRNGLAETRDDLKDWFRRQEERYGLVEEEITAVGKTTPLVEARISPETRQLLKEKLAAVSSVKMVLIATRELEHATGNLLILGMTSRQSMKDVLREGSGQHLKDLDQIEEAMSFCREKWLLVDLHQDFFMTKPLKRVENSTLIKR